MKIVETPLPGAYVIEIDRKGDSRGFFARMFCRREFETLGLIRDIVQVNNSLNSRAGTLRGLHYQLPPHEETKIVRCVRGILFDLLLDLRPGTETYGKSFGCELSAENRLMMYVPKGVAHGFITLVDDTEVIYFTDEYYAPRSERGVRWNDPQFNLTWPIKPLVIADKDADRPDFDATQHNALASVDR